MKLKYLATAVLGIGLLYTSQNAKGAEGIAKYKKNCLECSVECKECKCQCICACRK